jgi:F-type H+-transporting ATPase subunit epsilon
LADGANTLHARILTPEGEVFDGEVEQLSTRTAVGEIGILANHVPVLARLRPTILRLHLPGGEVKQYAQAEGWLQVFANYALVLAGEALPPEKLDESTLKDRIKDAEQRMSEAPEGSAARRRAELDKERAEAFLSAAGLATTFLETASTMV